MPFNRGPRKIAKDRSVTKSKTEAKTKKSTKKPADTTKMEEKKVEMLGKRPK
jgi:hypothetical protein